MPYLCCVIYQCILDHVTVWLNSISYENIGLKEMLHFTHFYKNTTAKLDMPSCGLLYNCWRCHILSRGHHSVFWLCYFSEWPQSTCILRGLWCSVFERISHLTFLCSVLKSSYISHNLIWWYIVVYFMISVIYICHSHLLNLLSSVMFFFLLYGCGYIRVCFSILQVCLYLEESGLLTLMNNQVCKLWK